MVVSVYAGIRENSMWNTISFLCLMLAFITFTPSLAAMAYFGVWWYVLIPLLSLVASYIAATQDTSHVG